MTEFSFESYGVKVRVESNAETLCETASAVANKALLDRMTPIDRDEADHVFILHQSEGRIFIELNGEYLGDSESESFIFKYFDTRVRLLIAECAVGYVFVHAGVVAWNGKALVFPADSFAGKTTLVAEFIKHGAVYYSDEYAVFDSSGRVYPFARPLSIRNLDGSDNKSDLPAESIGGTIGLDPLPVTVVLLTRFRPRSRWKPQVLSSGVGVLKMMSHAISLRFNPKFTLDALNKVASDAMIIEGDRSSANICVNRIVDFVDNLED